MSYTDEQKKQARAMYWQGTPVAEIAGTLAIEKRTLYNWAAQEDWSCLKSEDPQAVVYARLTRLMQIEQKSDSQLKELDRILAHIETMTRLRAKSTASAADDETGGEKRGKKKKAKNDFSGIDETELMEKFKKGLFGYQLDLWEHRNERNRNILKSRQIGLTFYFAREAFADALLTGKNKIFLSASRAQADVFRRYIKSFAREWFGAELMGKDMMEIHTPHGVATFCFLSTNSSTAQSYTGDVYIDEYFWIPKFAELKKVASGMGSQERWTRTYFSTPSAKSHQAYPFWSGDEFNESNKRANRPEVIFPDRARLRKGGTLCADGQWRRLITLDDAEREGCNLFNREQLKREYSEDEYRQLFDCYFIDDAQSCFQFADLQKCLVYTSDWNFFRPESEHPYAGPVWIGYDPSRSRDGACIAVVAPPQSVRGKFRVLEKITLKNAAWEYQAGTIRDLCGKYSVEQIGIDCTGPGSGVFEQVQRFFPAAQRINYTLDVKAKLVLKAQQVIQAGRIEWDCSYSDIAAGFLMIRRTTTQNANITYVADRSDLTGHADAAWAIMHALQFEDLIVAEEDDTVFVI